MHDPTATGALPVGGHEEFLVGATTDLPEVGGAVVELAGRRIAVVRDSKGEIHAIDDTCTHANVSLAEGEVSEDTIECWLHGSEFELTTGKPLSLPATQPVNVYPVRVDGTSVYVSVPV
ncbi:3-phenylpropionate/trans-cinnamate dioxygenase ferredoxin subunit [Kytococcus aerolatus]|uniref:3-phenylpropionate/trans-cinnamate dioxygenase ferredoxin subunit n=1 Tax=Kytococcus aerolatus TaxID=592308 RepID=A0A212T0R4_9MICO|nr:non-heme iron oxygenase ferredoxin subunit [Kytococcus aerolatus]SNC59595.1 3-phenylpropionate/trans-cinnamate dioxygenase ferredoxin subunit [Kytococcus aerolatus]